MKRKKRKPEPKQKQKFERPIRALHPDSFYRKAEVRPYFGYGPTQLDEKIESGEIPPPICLSETGAAKGWFGRTIIAWQAAREAAAAKNQAA